MSEGEGHRTGVGDHYGRTFEIGVGVPGPVSARCPPIRPRGRYFRDTECCGQRRVADGGGSADFEDLSMRASAAESESKGEDEGFDPVAVGLY